MNLSIIIPTLNRNNILKETIHSILFRQDYPIAKIEIIVINDGEGEIDLGDLNMEENNLKIIKNPSDGVCSARNLGARLAKNELLLFIDDDILISGENITRHVKLHGQYENALITGRWEYTEEFLKEMRKTPFSRYKLAYDYKCMKGYELLEFESGIFLAESLASFCLSLRKDLFEKTGGFDENFPHAGAEDQEFSQRAKKMGYTLLYDPTNICFHNEKDRLNIDAWLQRQYRGVMGFVYFAKKEPKNKEKELYYENTPINGKDSYKLKFKKIGKYILSKSFWLNLIRRGVGLMEKFRLPDKYIFKGYKILCGLYIYKGFTVSYTKLKNQQLQ